MSEMYKYAEKTIKAEIPCVGVGLHRGQKTTMILKPAPVGTGIVFVRTDITDKNNIIPATYLNVVDTRLNTCIGNKAGAVVSTIEHFMGALHALGVSNLRVELNGPEVPLMDGSAQDFVTLIECAGLKEQDAPQKALRVLKPVKVTEGDAFVELKPAPKGLKMSFMIDFPQSSVIGRQEESLELTADNFKALVARSRTFGFVADVEKLRAMGLAQGASLENVIAVEKDRVMNPEGLRDPHEFVAHKLLDAVGDLYQTGMPVIGIFRGEKSGHRHVNQLLRELMADHSAYEIVTLDEVEK